MQNVNNEIRVCPTRMALRSAICSIYLQLDFVFKALIKITKCGQESNSNHCPDRDWQLLLPPQQHSSGFVTIGLKSPDYLLILLEREGAPEMKGVVDSRKAHSWSELWPMLSLTASKPLSALRALTLDLSRRRTG